jgi:rfaE bifunctional protein nucleotidyltransferase chain/domain
MQQAAPNPVPRSSAKIGTRTDALARIARELGAALVVAVNSDASVRRLGKGDDRPLNTLDDRMAVVAALCPVDLVVPFDDDTPRDLIVAAMPDVLVKGGDYSAATTAGAAEVLAHGGRFVAIPFAFERSTSSLVARIRGRGSQ